MKNTETPSTPKFIAPYENCTDENPFLHAGDWFIPVWKVVRDGGTVTRTQLYYCFSDDKFISFSNLHEDRKAEGLVARAQKVWERERAERLNRNVERLNELWGDRNS